jgi:putative glutamine amidotransferase
VAVDQHTGLAAITGAGELAVNWFHHQAVDRLERELRAVAHAPDGLIEAIEGDGPALFLGVQWHAEGLIEDARHRALFEKLVGAAASRRVGSAA